jgi:hypothetical protein
LAKYVAHIRDPDVVVSRVWYLVDRYGKDYLNQEKQEQGAS